MSVECKANDPNFCPHHGVPFRLQKAKQSGDIEAYFDARSLLKNKEKQDWINSNISNYAKSNLTSFTQRDVLTPKEQKLLWKRLRGSYLLSELKQMDINSNTPVHVSFNRNGEAAFNYETTETQDIFSKGACGFLAYAIHQKTQLPLVIFTANPDATYWEGHVAVKIGEDQYLDVTGISTSNDYVQRYGLNQNTFNVEEVTEISKFKTIMGVAAEDNIYQNLGDLEKAILDKCSNDIIQDHVNCV